MSISFWLTTQKPILGVLVLLHCGQEVQVRREDADTAYEIKLEKQAECEEAVWCNIFTGNSALTVGLVYRSPNISTDENEKIQNAIKEVSKRD